MYNIAKRLAGLAGWRRNGVAFFCGVLATLTLPPVFAFPLLLPAFCGLFWLSQQAPTSKRAFADGWWWGWGYYVSGLYWFCIALLTDPEKFAWMIPFALFGLTGVIAIYNGVATWLAYRMRAQGIIRILLFPVVWMLVEYARGHLFTGFPWNLAGYSFAVSDALMQPASLVGIYGLTWFAVAVGISPALWGMKKNVFKREAAISLLPCILLLLAYGWGQARMIAFDASDQNRVVPGVKIRLVQANIAQHHKWNPDKQMQGLYEHIRLTQQEGLEKITHIIWPETAIPYAISADSPITHIIAENLPEGKVLISGALRIEGDVNSKDWQIWNSVMAFDADGSIIGTYDKSKLVPFGEFLPFRSIIPEAWLTPVGIKDFSAGSGPSTVKWQGLPTISPLVCYEAIFPELAVNRQEPPALLLTLTNDAWFGASSGPYQHFHMARMRAVEQGIALVRSANTGISGLVDPLGRVKNIIPLNNSGILDIAVPVSLNEATFYSKYSNLAVWFGVVLLLVGQILARVIHMRE